MDHYQISERSLMLFMSGEREISFRMNEKLNNEKDRPIPVLVYQTEFPGTRAIQVLRQSQRDKTENGILALFLRPNF